MEGEASEDLASFSSDIRTLFRDQVAQGTIELVDPGLNILEVSYQCPDSTIEAFKAAEVYALDLSIEMTMSPWLD